MAGDGGSTVPKFSSFKPKPKKGVAETNNVQSSEERGGEMRRQRRPISPRDENPRSSRDRPRSRPRPSRGVERYHDRPDATKQVERRPRSREASPRGADRYRSHVTKQASRQRSHEADRYRPGATEQGSRRPSRDSDSYRPGAIAQNTRRPSYEIREGDRHRGFDATLDAQAQNDRSDPSDRARESRRDNQEPSEQSSDLYMIDTRGDSTNSQYRKSNKWSVPLYHLYGSGSVVGHDPDVKIDRNLSNDHGFTLRYPPKKQKSTRVEPIDTDDLTEPRPDVGRGDGEVKRGDEIGHESTETDFVPLPGQEQSKAQLPIITQKL